MSKIFIPYEEFKTEYLDVNYFSGVNELLGVKNFETVLGFSDSDLDEYFTDLHGDSIYAYPINYPITTDIAIQFSQKIDRIVKRTVKANKNKYLAALQMFTADYKPDVNNFVDEKETTGLKVDRNKTTSGPDGAYSTTTSITGDKTTETQVAPFDSSIYNNQQKVIETMPSTTTSINGSLKSESEPTNTKTSSLGADFNIGENNSVNDRILHREGNIGVRSTQELWTQELELKAYNLIEELFKDIKKTICLSVY